MVTDSKLYNLSTDSFSKLYHYCGFSFLNFKQLQISQYYPKGLSLVLVLGPCRHGTCIWFFEGSLDGSNLVLVGRILGGRIFWLWKLL